MARPIQKDAEYDGQAPSSFLSTLSNKAKKSIHETAVPRYQQDVLVNQNIYIFQRVGGAILLTILQNPILANLAEGVVPICFYRNKYNI